MVLHPHYSSVSGGPSGMCTWNRAQRSVFATFDNGRQRSNSSSTAREESRGRLRESLALDSSCAHRFCSCGRRPLIGALAAPFLPIPPSNGSPSNSDSVAALNRVHPSRPDWYEELYAYVLNSCMKVYEKEVAGYKTQLFSNLEGKVQKVLEIGIGTGPNLKYYSRNSGVHVFGVDPNRKMEKYARAAALAAGLPPTNFEFTQAVAEALPLGDASVDAVVGTLVLCSVGDVDATLKEVRRVLRPGGLYLFVEHVAAEGGTILRFVQNVLDPIQQTVSDGCHLTRKTGKNISEAGFSHVDINSTSVFRGSPISPHVYGIARK